LTTLYSRTSKHSDITTDDPWIIQACFVSDSARIEIVESRYRKVFPSFECNSWRGISVLHDLATADVYLTGFTPIQFVKKMDLYCTIDDWLDVNEAQRDPQYWPQIRTRPSWKSCFDALGQIIDKAHFDMCIQFEGNGFSVKHLGHLLETFRPVYSELVAAGAQVSIVFCQCYLVDGAKQTDLITFYDKQTDLRSTTFYKMERLDWYGGFRKTVGGWYEEYRAKKPGVPDRRRWNVEGDEEFDRAVASGSIRY
jgi:hypothetical protein